MHNCGADSHNRCPRAAVSDWVVQEVASIAAPGGSPATVGAHSLETPLTCHPSPGRRTPVSVGVNGIAPGAAIGKPPRRDHNAGVQGYRRAVHDAPPARQLWDVPGRPGFRAESAALDRGGTRLSYCGDQRETWRGRCCRIVSTIKPTRTYVAAFQTTT